MNNNTLKNTLKLLVLAVPLGLAACATSNDLNALSERVDKAQATADEALSKATAAQTTADQAATSSMDASRKADAAVQTANDAKAAVAAMTAAFLALAGENLPITLGLALVAGEETTSSLIRRRQDRSRRRSSFDAGPRPVMICGMSSTS